MNATTITILDNHCVRTGRVSALPVSIDGQNGVDTLEFIVPESMADWAWRVEIEQNGKKTWRMMEDGHVWTVRAGEVVEGYGKIQAVASLQSGETTLCWKTREFDICVFPSINASEAVTPGEASALDEIAAQVKSDADRADAAATRAEDAAAGAENIVNSAVETVEAEGEKQAAAVASSGTQALEAIGQVEQTAIAQVQAAGTAQVGAVEDAGDSKLAQIDAANAHAPQINEATGKWQVWDTQTGAYVDTDTDAQGPRGETGATGPQGPAGADGVGLPAATAEDAGKAPVVGADGSYTLGEPVPEVDTTLTEAGAPADAAAVGAAIEAISPDDGAVDGKPWTSLKILNVLKPMININDWGIVQHLVNQGLGPWMFPIGSQLFCDHQTYGKIAWDVVAHDQHKNPNDASAHTMTLLMHACIYGRMIDASEMLWANTGESALPAGTYNFTLYKGGNSGRTEEDGTYQFTITEPIPAGGGWTHNKVGNWYEDTANYKPENITSGVVTTYDASGNQIEGNLTVTAGSGGTSLGTASNAQGDIVDTVGRFNSVMRRAYGSNHWGESAARQWLNSDAAANAWWTKQTIFDLKPNYANQPGFLNGLDADFLAAVGPVDSVTAYNTVYDVNGTITGTYTTRDRFWLPSRVEMGYGPENSISEGSVLPYYDGASESDKIKYDITNEATARYWWLRSPNPWNAYVVRYVYPSGALNNNVANSGYGLAAACVIYAAKNQTIAMRNDPLATVQALTDRVAALEQAAVNSINNTTEE